MRYLIGLMALTLIGCASPARPPVTSQSNRGDASEQTRSSFVGHWKNEDPSKAKQPVSIDVHSDGTFGGLDHDGDHSSGKWKATSKTSAEFTEDGDTEIVSAELSGSDQLVLTAAGEPPLKFKRQR
jgi:hypothetical protein